MKISLLLPLAVALLYWTASARTQFDFVGGLFDLIPEPGSPAPIAIALFRFANDEGTLISEAGIEAVGPFARVRILVDQADALTGLAVAKLGAGESTVRLTPKSRRFGAGARASGERRALFCERSLMAPDFFRVVDLQRRRRGERSGRRHDSSGCKRPGRRPGCSPPTTWRWTEPATFSFANCPTTGCAALKQWA